MPDDPSYTPIDLATLSPDQFALWIQVKMDTPLPANVSRQFRDDEFRYACSLACTPLDEDTGYG